MHVTIRWTWTAISRTSSWRNVSGQQSCVVRARAEDRVDVRAVAYWLSHYVRLNVHVNRRHFDHIRTTRTTDCVPPLLQMQQRNAATLRVRHG